MAQKDYTFDALLELKDAGAVTSDDAGTVDASDKIVDLGAARCDGVMVVDVSALSVADGDERYDVKLQGSSSSTFASGIVNLATLVLGDSSVTGASADSTTGRYEVPFTNEHDGTVYRYVRAFVDGTGTSWSINYTAWLAKH